MESIKPKNIVYFQEEGHTYQDANRMKVPSVSFLLEYFKLADYSHSNERALEFGKNVHKTCELYDLDNLDWCDPAIEPYLEQWKKAKIAINDDIIAIEQPLISNAWCYAGTPDRVLKHGICDIKTGLRYACHAIQTAFYSILAEENYGIKVKHRYTIYLGKKLDIVEHKDRSDISIAKSLIQIYNWKKLNKLLEV